MSFLNVFSSRPTPKQVAKDRLKSNPIEGESPSLVANIPIKNIKGKAR